MVDLEWVVRMVLKAKKRILMAPQKAMVANLSQEARKKIKIKKDLLAANRETRDLDETRVCEYANEI